MINLLIGAPGGGKSYEAVVYHILPALQGGRLVITNLPLNLDYIALVNCEYLPLIKIITETKKEQPVIDWAKSESMFKKFGITQKQTYFNKSAFSHVEDYFCSWRHPETGSGALYVIDECHIPLPSKGTEIAVEHWYSMHRHESADVLLLTQSYGKINQAIRDLVQICYRVRKNTALGSQSSYVRKVQDGVRGEVVNTAIREYKKEFFPFYQSHTKGGGSELAANDITPIWMRWPVIGSAIMFTLFFVIVLTGNFKNPMNADNYTKSKEGQNVTISSAGNAAQSLTIPEEAKKQIDLKTLQAIPLDLAKTEPQIEQKKEVKTDPYASNGLHLVGHVTSKKKTLWIISISQNGQRLKNIYPEDLAKVGYYFEPISDCAAWLNYKTERRFLKCDAPGVNPTGGTSPLASAES